MDVDRRDVLAMLSTMQGRPAGIDADTIDSLELVWLLHQVEKRNSVRLDLDDDDLSRMNTVDGAVAVLNRVLLRERA
ncbi:MAG TPA: hypothetical protein VGJ28_27065 [Micromonosporaceae bacterium]|jgi:hypothetical protein